MAQKRLNKPVVIGLTLFLFAVMIGLSAVMLVQMRKRDPQYFANLAETAAKQEHWEQAGLFYREAWRRSKDATYLVKLGDALLELGDVNNALASWSQALITQPDLLIAHRTRLGVLHEIAKLSRQTKSWQEVLRAAEAMLDKTSPEDANDRGFALHAKGMALLNLAKVDPANNAKGLEALEAAVGTSPDKVTYAVDLVRNYILQGKRDDAKALLDELISHHPNHDAAGSRARAAYAMYQADAGNDEAALAYFKDAIDYADPSSDARLEAQLACSTFLMKQWAKAQRGNPDSDEAHAKFEEVEKLLRGAIDEHPDSYDPYTQLATLYQSAGKNEEAIKVCDARLSRGLSRRGVHATRDRHQTFVLMILASENCVSLANKAQEDKQPELAEKDLKRAEQYVADARGEVPDHPRVLAQSGQIKAARGEYRAALEDLRAADEGYRSFDVTDWANKTLLARVHLRLGEPGAARRVLEDVLPKARATRANDANFWLLYAQTLVETDDLERARFIVDSILRAKPDLAPAQRLKAAILERQGRANEAGKLIQQATGDKALGTILEARHLALDGNHAGAIDKLTTALKDDPGNVRLVSAAVSELVGQDKSDEAAAIVKKALAVDPNDAQLKRLAVLVAPGLTKEERDSRLLAQIKSEEDGYRRALDEAGYYIQRNSLPDALTALTEAEQHLISKDTPMAKQARVAQLRAVLRLKMRAAGDLDDQKALAETRDTAAKYDVDGTGGKALLGLYHRIRHENDLAIRALQQAVKRQPTDAWAQNLLGQCLFDARRTEEARAAFEAALRADPRSGPAHKGLALIAIDAGDDDAIDEQLKACERLIPNDPWVRSVSTARIERADPRGAIERREKMLKDDPDNIENLKRLAALSEQVGDRERADRYYGKLLDLRLNDREIVSVAAAYYRRSGRPEKSLETLHRYIDAQEPGAPRNAAKVLLAVHYIDLKNYDEAERVLTEAAQSSKSLDVILALADFYMKDVVKPDRAIPWLDKAVSLAEDQHSPRLSRIIQARIQCKLSRTVDDVAGAQKDVDLLSARFPESADDTMWQGEVYVQAGRIADAIKSFSDYLAQSPSNVEALFRRAQLYTAQSNYNAAITDLEAIKRINPVAHDMKPRLLLARLYLRVDKPDRCLDELKSAVADAPKSEQVLQTLVKTYIELGKAAQADTIVTAQINRGGDKPDPRWLKLRAQVSWTLGDFDRALSDYRQAIQLAGSLTANDMVTMLDIFFWAHRYSEGIDYYDAHASQVSKDARVEGRLAALMVRNGDEQGGSSAFRRAAQLTPADDASAALDLAVALHMAYPDEKAIDPALATYAGEPDQGPQGVLDTRLRIQLKQLAGRNEDALGDIEKLLPHTESAHAKALLLHQRGELLQALGRMEASRQAYEQALTFNADDWRTQNNLAYLLTNDLNACDAGLEHAKRAVELDANANALDTLGWTYACLGDNRNAIAELSRSLRKDSSSALTKYHLGEVYRRDGAFTEADESLTTALDLARKSGDNAMVTDIEASIERVKQRDRTR